MANSNNLNLQQAISDNLQQMLDISVSAMKPIVDGLTNNFSALNKSVMNVGGVSLKIPQITTPNCCAPKHECPPHCISNITRQALPGERIIVAFIVKNSCTVTKTWRVGVRELKDENGNLAPAQPILNKQKLTLDAGRSEKVLMEIDLARFQSGSNYQAEIVLREKEFNQNICFTLQMKESDATVVSPLDEQKYRLKWQDWQSHFYCEIPRRPVAQQQDVIKVETVTKKIKS